MPRVCIHSTSGPQITSDDHAWALKQVTAINRELGKPALWLVPVDPEAPQGGIRTIRRPG